MVELLVWSRFGPNAGFGTRSPVRTEKLYDAWPDDGTSFVIPQADMSSKLHANDR